MSLGWLVALVVTVVAAVAITRWLAGGGGIVILDHPNERSLHDQPVPRTGGLAIVAALVLGHATALVFGLETALGAALVIACALVFAVSVADDLRPLPAVLRLVVHLAAAGVLMVSGFAPETLSLPGRAVEIAPGLASVLGVLFVTWLTNLYNFMDGMDGFAGGMGCIGFGCYALLALAGGDPGLALSAALLALACAGFLSSNFPPARIFMGDAGSSVLGFLAAAFTLYAERNAVFPLWLGVVVFSPFIVDATLTLVRRAVRGEVLWHAHRSHHYQRLVRAGWSHRRTTSWGYALMLLCALLAWLLADASALAQWLGLLCLAGIYAILVWYVQRLERTVTSS